MTNKLKRLDIRLNHKNTPHQQRLKSKMKSGDYGPTDKLSDYLEKTRSNSQYSCGFYSSNVPPLKRKSY